MPHAWSDHDEKFLPRHRRNGMAIGTRDTKPKRRIRAVAPMPKPCIIKFKGDVPCGWNEEKKILVIGAQPAKLFLSHAQALKARWHTIQNINKAGLTQPGGDPFHSNDYVLVDV